MGKYNNKRARKFRPNQQMRRNPKTGKVEKFEEEGFTAFTTSSRFNQDVG